MTTPPRETLLLDASEEIVLLDTPAESRVLGRDPFESLTAPDPFLERLDAEAPERPRQQRSAAAPGRSRGAPSPRRRARRRHTPRVADVEAGAPEGLLDRVVGEEERRRLRALEALVEPDRPYDHYGFSPAALRRAFPFFHFLYRVWFRVQSEGHDRLPEGAAVLVGNHGGLLPFDGAMAVLDVVLHTDPPRLPRAIIERWAGTLPWVNVFYARMGQVIGTRENFADLLRDSHLVLVFPEGIAGIRKPIAQRYRLQSFHVGFVEQALRARVPIVPVAFLGADDQAPILYDIKPLARRLGLPVAPITPTFPWLGPLGLLPYPVRYRIIYGEPLRFHERFGPEGADDARLVEYLAKQVRRTIQLMIDKNR